MNKRTLATATLALSIGACGFLAAQYPPNDNTMSPSPSPAPTSPTDSMTNPPGTQTPPVDQSMPNANPSVSPSPSPFATPNPMGGTGTQQLKKAMGNIQSIDPASGQIVIQQINGTMLTVSTDNSTMIHRGTKLITLSDIVQGDRVSVRYEPDSKLASRIDVLSSAR